MKSYSILSPNDGQLLIRMHDELVKGGMKSLESWNKDHNPNEDNELAILSSRAVYYYCLKIYANSYMQYHNHNGLNERSDAPELINLTPENFDEVLEKVLANN